MYGTFLLRYSQDTKKKAKYIDYNYNDYKPFSLIVYRVIKNN